MADIFTKKKRSEVMSKVRHKDSKIEVQLRKKLWQAGFRYLKNSRKYYGKPDIVLPKYKTVIFVDSCFWHGCKQHGTLPSTRKKFWTNKIETNRNRDKKVNRYYRKKDWQSVRVWEHEIKRDIDKIIKNLRII